MAESVGYENPANGTRQCGLERRQGLSLLHLARRVPVVEEPHRLEGQPYLFKALPTN